MNPDSPNTDLVQAVQSIAAAMKDLTTAPYQVAFSVFRTAAHNSQAVDSVVAHDTKLYDYGSNVDIVTNKGRFTAPYSGLYHFSATAGNTAATATIMRSGLALNGTVVKLGNQAVPGTANNLFHVSGDIPMLKGQYVEHTFVGGGGSVMQPGQSQSFFDGFYIKPL